MLSWPKARIEICGPLGSGKTTLLNLLAHFGATPIYEPVQQHPYLEDFYSNPPKYALEKCCFFALDYLHSLKTHSAHEGTVALDASVPLLRAYHDMAPLRMDERLMADDLLDGIAAQLPPADLYIHLSADTQYLLKRIAKRGRDMEATVSADYVDGLNRRLDHHISRVATHSRLLALELQTLEGRTTPETIAPIIESIHKALSLALEAKASKAEQQALPLAEA